MFLEICDMYLKKHGIKNPVAVELGVWKNRQKKFYEQILGAEHIGIDFSNTRSTPDIIGNTHAPETMKALKEKLNGRPINILFIDASHFYKNVSKDFKLYSPLCSDIIAFHDVESCRYLNKRPKMQVWKFWDDLKAKAAKGAKEYKDMLFLSIYKGASNMGIGMMIKK